MKNTVLALLLIFVLGALPCFYTSAEKGPSSMLVLGDSISTGYGLDGYVSGSVNGDIQNYGNIASSQLGLRPGKSYTNLAVDGYTSTDLLSLITEKESFVSDYDMVIISIGGNDIIHTFMPFIAEALGIDSNTGAGLDGFLNSGTNAKVVLDEKQMRSLLTKMTAAVAVMQSRYTENLGKIIDNLKRVNQNGEIYVQTLYDPFDDADYESDYGGLPASVIAVVRQVINAQNNLTKTTASEHGAVLLDVYESFRGQGSKLTNILSFDIHPNAQGHGKIASLILNAADAVAIQTGKEDDGGTGTSAVSDTDTQKSENANSNANANDTDSLTRNQITAILIILGLTVLGCTVIASIFRFREKKKQ